MRKHDDDDDETKATRKLIKEISFFPACTCSNPYHFPFDKIKQSIVLYHYCTTLGIKYYETHVVGRL